MHAGGVFNRKRDAVSRETERLRSIWVSPKNLSTAEQERVFGKAMEHEYSLADLLRRPDVNYDALMSLEGSKFASAELDRTRGHFDGGGQPVAGQDSSDAGQASDVAAARCFRAAVAEQVEVTAKYSGYIDRQRSEIDRAAHYENLRLPPDIDYLKVSALSFEARQTLTKHRPETLGLASRISGITPASISLLLVHLKKGGMKRSAISAS